MTKKPKMPMHPQRRKFLEHQANRKIAKQLIKADKAAALRNKEEQDAVRPDNADAIDSTADNGT